MLAGGPARETESECFRLHMEGLGAQGKQVWSAGVSRPDRPTPGVRLDLTIRHETCADLGGPRWHHAKIERVAKARQGFLDEAGDPALHKHLASRPRAVFLVDTDVVCGPGVLERMWYADADVVYGVYWTEGDGDGWGARGTCYPQVWDVHPYGFSGELWTLLNQPGVHEIPVLGGGACTLIRGRGFESRYWPLLESMRYGPGISFGEDRTFSLGLETRGIRQVAVTGLPIAHAYSDELRSPGWLDVLRREVGL